MTVYYTLKDLTLKLQKEGLPASRPYLNQLEKDGVIPIPNNSVHYRVRNASKIALSEMRIYTLQDIANIVKKVRKYKENLVRKNGKT